MFLVPVSGGFELDLKYLDTDQFVCRGTRLESQDYYSAKHEARRRLGYAGYRLDTDWHPVGGSYIAEARFESRKEL